MCTAVMIGQNTLIYRFFWFSKSDIMIIYEYHEQLAKKFLKNFQNFSTESAKTGEQKCKRSKKDNVQSEQALGKAKRFKEWENGRELGNGVENTVGIILRSFCETRRALKTFKFL